MCVSRHRGHQRVRAAERRRERRRRARHSDDGKKRRSLNLPDPNHEKFAWLYKTRRNAVVEVTADGDVRTTTNRSSVYCTHFTAHCTSDAATDRTSFLVASASYSRCYEDVSLSCYEQVSDEDATRKLLPWHLGFTDRPLLKGVTN